MSISSSQPRKFSLSLTIGMVFALSVIPILLFMVVFSYQTNSQNLLTFSKSYAETNSRNTIAAVEALLAPVASTLRMAASVASIDPSFFRQEKSRNYLHSALVSSPQIDALYASFEDGYHRVVTRVDEDRRRFDAEIPKEANWHSSYMNAYHGKSKTRLRYRSFFEVWKGPVLAAYSYKNSVDIRRLPHYIQSKKRGTLAFGDPSVNPDTGAPVISQGFPIVHQGKFIGFIGANSTFNIISKHLRENQVTPNSVTMIVDESGRVIAHPEPKKGVRRIPGGSLTFAELDGFTDLQVRDAFKLWTETGKNRITYETQGKEYLASFNRFPKSFGKKWQVLVVTPVDDFLGRLKEANKQLLLILSALTVIELLIIFAVSKKLANPIKKISGEMDGLRTLSFESIPARTSMILEISQLQEAVALMQNSLKSFAAFVPLGVVRELVRSGKPLSQGMESQELTILFTDLENFTTISEELSPEQLSSQLSEYFEVATSAIVDEGGTIDKFIGDAVMAFWGAPVKRNNPQERACRAALRILQRNNELNERWASEGKPTMKVRIGLHHGKVLVGNIGSSDRLSYTVIGDGVNVAARLEGINKVYGTQICISDEVCRAVKDSFQVRLIEVAKVKGREEGVKIYELMGSKS